MHVQTPKAGLGSADHHPALLPAATPKTSGHSINNNALLREVSKTSVPPGYRLRRWSHSCFSSGLCFSPCQLLSGTLQHSHAFSRAAAHETATGEGNKQNKRGGEPQKECEYNSSISASARARRETPQEDKWKKWKISKRPNATGTPDPQEIHAYKLRIVRVLSETRHPSRTSECWPACP